MNEWLLMLGGATLLYFGAEWFVGGASSLALSLRVPQLLVGLTVVAYGTSAPEIIVGVQAALAGHGDVALGNVTGSNISNLGLILGLCALVRPARVDGALRRREVPMLLASAAAMPVVLADGVVSRLEGLVLLGIAVAYTGVMVRAARSTAERGTARQETQATAEATRLAGAPSGRSWWVSALTATAGLGVLLLGGNLFVEGAVEVARALGVSDRVVGLTIVAVGTSLPELVTSLIAAARGQSDIAVGNVVGSNIFNVFMCLGVAALPGPITTSFQAVLFDLAALAVMTGLAAVFLRTERTVSRLEGGLLLGLYVAFTVVVVAKG